MFLKRFAPESLYGRFLLIVIIPIVVVIAVATYMFYERHWESVSRNLAASLAGEIGYVVAKVAKADEADRSEILDEFTIYLHLDASYLPDGTSLKNVKTLDKEYGLLQAELRKSFNYPFELSDLMPSSEIIIVITLPDGKIAVTVPKKRMENPTTYIFTMWIIGTAAILLIVAILFLRVQVRSIIRLAKAAENFGRGQETKKFKPEGAKEVRMAAKSFIKMKERIKRQIDQRTEMLAGISHDLRTPLTRMKLQLAMLKKSAAKKELEEDVAEMEHMVEGYLDFVRGEDNEPSKTIGLQEFLKKIISGYKNHKDSIKLICKSEIEINVRSRALKRAITNIINNAVRFGKQVNITIDEVRDHADIIIDDDGPGIPRNKWDEVFQPFYRMEESRNQETGGVGLGMSIARDIIHRHGGGIKLAESRLGGLRVIISLPI